jgi:rod shape-determining protein MreD
LNLLRALAVLGVCLGLQVGLGRVSPEAYRWVDLLYVPVVWYAIAGSQRSAMLVGCVAGLLQDAWFHGGVFGLNGFKKTLLGWAFGGLGSRFDLGQTPFRFLGGFGLALLDALLDLGLRRVLAREIESPDPWWLLGRAAITGLAVVAGFAVADRLHKDGMPRRRGVGRVRL